MPLFSPKRKISDAENKLRVLLCLRELGMATQEQLWPFVARLELMEYVPFCLFLDELKATGAIATGRHALDGMLYLTETGGQQLALFAGKVPHADRERILQLAPAYREELSMRKQVRAAHEPRGEDGRYGAALTLREGDLPTLYLRLHTPSRALAAQAVRGFQAQAPQVLNLCYTLDLLPQTAPLPRPLSQEAAIDTAAPEHPVLCAFGGREHAAVARVEEERAQYTVLLLLPSAQLAWDWAQAADRSGAHLARALTDLLGDEPRA